MGGIIGPGVQGGQLGYFLGGSASSSLVITGPYSPAGTVSGFAQGPGNNILEIDSTGSLFPNMQFVGAVGTAQPGATARVSSKQSDGSTIFGSALSVYPGNVAEVSLNGRGQFAGGFAQAFFSGSDAYVRNRGAGSFVWGYAQGSYGRVFIQTGSNDFGSMVVGNITGYYGTSYIESRGSGQFINGYIYNFGTGVVGIRGGAGGRGQFVQGSANNYYNGAQTVQIAGGANAKGAFAQGYAYTTAGPYSSQIQATGNGAFARGMTYASTVNTSILASGAGSFAVGYAKNATIEATAENAFQFGVGSNSLANSLQVGNSGIRFKGTVGAPAALQNGDMWVANNFVYIRSNGISQQI